ncbi:very low-density lipoprotein receptor isoform X2 [Etheostoma spectabile]|uniref:very low-density lipoprotein receptor isoform X2 n=1 Tax=Etheostoma spectabile TaxID=54343 RepID=UPI0013AF3037|nr:very low-density lipoprotein receptor-like isoform X2 [Etheostoma spectabile]
MGNLGGLFLFLAPLIWCHVWGHSLPACHEQLEFRCSDGLCIPRSEVCDGHTDCKDGSDEHHCGHLWCKKDEFACCNGRCISSRFLCNGVDDCEDGSDEAFCQNCTTPGSFSCKPSDTCNPQTSPKCTSSEFQCGDGHCIRQNWRCDNSPDCSDGSDEDNCDQNECEVNNGGCSHQCVDQKMGFHCDCPGNMRLVGDSHCEEVDTCLENDVCDQLCVHINGSLACDCHEDYQMNPTTRECKAKGNVAQLFFTSSKGMCWTSIAGTEYRELAAHLQGPGPVAALASNRTLYWARQGKGSIYRISMDGKLQDSVLVLKVQGSVSGLAVDWVHHLLYWTSMESGSVNVGLLDGSAQRRLIARLDKPSAVALDPLQGLLFWAQSGRPPKIERAKLDGRDRMALVTSLILYPVALSLDMPRQRCCTVDQD